MLYDRDEKRPLFRCEDCVFFDYDDDLEDHVCTADMDQDELARLPYGTRAACPYYRPHDEYRSVRRQI